MAPGDRQISLKGRLPLRLGATSYIIPADILPNVEFLAGRVDDVELVLFESDQISNLPDDAVIARLHQVAGAHALTYTVHLPLDARLGAGAETARISSVGMCLRVVERTRSLGAFAYVVHLDPPGPGEDPAGWLSALRRSVGELLAGGIEARRLCVENLSYPFEQVEGVVEEFGLSVCIDVGHVLLGGRDLAACLDRLLPRCRVLHLHGIVDGRDHRSAAALGPRVLRLLRERLSAPDAPERVLTLEVFDRQDLEDSLLALEGWTQ
jgi:sugar phosphate isomerase/epimerase